ncbi:early light-induced protein 1, chloroplastic isoform X2 [Amborella trichopoda]|uniref:early light-induced protein 1, chloroplastic isoform X2 n=1 Tax=Amborella trichopoda TaxID=13333 RepID=UPI0009C16CE3|nr:early light-induced protein 1, chloroplastic isoform X2 [Amborella trichopoda]|eukprot:XP_020520229.1 early light-induced protein 1, chloroplastic isoform X2 [Amborella trichopoda]
MAAASALHSIVACSATGGVGSRRSLYPSATCLASRRARSLMSDNQEQSAPVDTPSTPKNNPSPPPPPPKKVSPNFTDILAFSGPGPERINGRLAMVGFVSALGVELARGNDVASQLASGGLWWFVGSSAVLTLASLIPLLKGVDVESKKNGIMNPEAEIWNGRFAMLGLVALVFTEYLKGGALVQM